MLARQHARRRSRPYTIGVWRDERRQWQIRLPRRCLCDSKQNRERKRKGSRRSNRASPFASDRRLSESSIPFPTTPAEERISPDAFGKRSPRSLELFSQPPSIEKLDVLAQKLELRRARRNGDDFSHPQGDE